MCHLFVAACGSLGSGGHDLMCWTCVPLPNRLGKRAALLIDSGRTKLHHPRLQASVVICVCNLPRHIQSRCESSFHTRADVHQTHGTCFSPRCRTFSLFSVGHTNPPPPPSTSPTHSTGSAVACADADASGAQPPSPPYTDTDTDTGPEEAAQEAPVETAAERLGVMLYCY